MNNIMKTLLLIFTLASTMFAEMDSIKVTWIDPVDADLSRIRIMYGTSNDTSAMTKLDSVNAGVQSYIWGSANASTTYWFSTLAVDQSGNVSYYSNTDSVTTVAGGDTLGTNLVVNGTMEANSSWSTLFSSTNSQSSDQAYAGTYSWYIDATVSGTGSGVYQNITGLETDSTYWVEGYYYITSGRAYIDFNGGAVYSDLGGTEDAWIYFKFKRVYNGGSAEFQIATFGESSTLYYDNVSIRKRIGGG